MDETGQHTSKDRSQPASTDTRVVHSGKTSADHHGAVNTPVYHASTLLFPTVEGFLNRGQAEYRYGRRGTPTTKSLEAAVVELEKADAAFLAPSGKAANSAVLTALAEPGSHYLVTDSAYNPTRSFCTGFLSRHGIETEFYDPTIGAGIADLIRPNTRLVWMESPGSQTFEVQDVPAIVAAAKAKGIVTAIDNTWSGGYFFQPLTLGVDISVQAITKYIGGHSDLMMGVVATAPGMSAKMNDFCGNFGLCVGPDDAYLALRGMRTLAARMNMHYRNSKRVAEWLSQHPRVSRVMYPGLETDPGHNIWRRDFTGTSGLFGFVIEGESRQSIPKMLEHMRYFGMGSSWGGYESLLIPTYPEKQRSATEWKVDGQSMRIHVGLEDADDLLADLSDGFDRLK